ncbi:MAG: ankyrin repeat domain-containing protein, partial [Verrucomicrobiota bacterium]|nr:ankyrin repeat domain-containing protein [Verrucomicrobiota bacterium]
MKHILITTIAAVVLVVGCGPSVDIHDAAAKGDIEAVKGFLAAGTNVNARIITNRSTPLHKAAYRGHKEVVELLIAKGADVNAIDHDRSTPLHSATYKGHYEIAKLLIAKGAEVNAK